jgi:hypothetical protein
MVLILSSIQPVLSWGNGGQTAGTMIHYIADVAVFGHVMGSKTLWKTEVHHSDYESYVDDRTGAYNSSFNSYYILTAP